MNQTPDQRLGAAIRNLAGASIARFDVRATIALTVTMAVLWFVAHQIPIPDALWYAFGGITGYFFPRPTQETTRA